MLEREGHFRSPARKQSRPVFLLPSLTSTEGHSSHELYTSLCPVETKQEEWSVGFWLTSGNTFPLWGWLSTGTACPGRLWQSLSLQVLESWLDMVLSGQVAVGGSAWAETGPDELLRCLQTLNIMGEDFGLDVLILCWSKSRFQSCLMKSLNFEGKQ